MQIKIKIYSELTTSIANQAKKDYFINNKYKKKVRDKQEKKLKCSLNRL